MMALATGRVGGGAASLTATSKGGHRGSTGSKGVSPTPGATNRGAGARGPAATANAMAGGRSESRASMTASPLPHLRERSNLDIIRAASTRSVGGGGGGGHRSVESGFGAGISGGEGGGASQGHSQRQGTVSPSPMLSDAPPRIRSNRSSGDPGTPTSSSKFGPRGRLFCPEPSQQAAPGGGAPKSNPIVVAKGGGGGRGGALSIEKLPSIPQSPQGNISSQTGRRSIDIEVGAGFRSVTMGRMATASITQLSSRVRAQEGADGGPPSLVRGSGTGRGASSLPSNVDLTTDAAPTPALNLQLPHILQSKRK